MQAKAFNKSYSQTFSLDQSFQVGGNFGSFVLMFTSELKQSDTLTWTLMYQNSTSMATVSTASLSVQGPPCGNMIAGQGPCSPVYDASGNQPTQFDVYQDNLYGTFMFAPVDYYTSMSGSPPSLSSLSPTLAVAGGS